MAIKYSEIKKSVISAPLSTEELILISDAESYIDTEITRKFDSNIYHEVRIAASYCNFH